MKSTTILSNQQIIKQSFLALASSKLTVKERKVISMLLQNKNVKNATQTVKDISSSLSCAPSTAWSVLRSLKSMHLVNYGEKTLLEISESGKLLVKGGVC